MFDYLGAWPAGTCRRWAVECVCAGAVGVVARHLGT